MSYTEAQRLVLKNYILADEVLSTKASGEGADYVFISNALNAEAAPAFVCWKTSVDPTEIMRNGMDWTRVDNLSVGKARIWDWLTSLGFFDASKVNIRAGIDATWVGAAADLAVRAIVYTHCKRSATLAEKLLATGVGTDQSPAVFGWEGQVGVAEIGSILA